VEKISSKDLHLLNPANMGSVAYHYVRYSYYPSSA